MDVTQTLQKDQSQYPSIEVEKEDTLTYDLGNLLAFDTKPLDSKSFRENAEKCIADTARDDVQLLFNKLFSLPTRKVPGEIGVLADLPPPTTVIPREKPLPKPKPETKWEKFAKLKGITKKKKERMVYDSNGELKPRWGYKRKDDLADEWVIESKPGDDPSVDPFTKKEQEKKERVSKQAKREKANRLETQSASKNGIKLPSTISITNDFKTTTLTGKKSDVDKSLKIARQSTISMGKFDRLLPGEKPLKEKKKYSALFSDEQSKNSKVLDKVLGNTDPGSMNMTKAVNQVITSQQTKRNQTNKKQSAPKKQKKK